MVTNGHKWAYKGYKHGVMTRGRPSIYRGARRAILAIWLEPRTIRPWPTVVHLWESKPETGERWDWTQFFVYEPVWILSLPFWLWSWEVLRNCVCGYCGCLFECTRVSRVSWVSSLVWSLSTGIDEGGFRVWTRGTAWQCRIAMWKLQHWFWVA